jgi:hypothetical protein
MVNGPNRITSLSERCCHDASSARASETSSRPASAREVRETRKRLPTSDSPRCEKRRRHGCRAVVARVAASVFDARAKDHTVMNARTRAIAVANRDVAPYLQRARHNCRRHGRVKWVASRMPRDPPRLASTLLNLTDGMFQFAGSFIAVLYAIRADPGKVVSYREPGRKPSMRIANRRAISSMLPSIVVITTRNSWPPGAGNAFGAGAPAAAACPDEDKRLDRDVESPASRLNQSPVGPGPYWTP